MKIKHIKILPVTLRLRNTFRTALGQKNITQNLFVVLRLSNGIGGCGEASSSLAMPESTPESMSKILFLASSHILNQSIYDWENISDSLRKKFPTHPTAISAVECALLDAYCRLKKIPLARFFGQENKKIETYFTIPALKLHECEKIVKRMVKKGFRKFKVKITGENLNEDFNRVSLVYKMTGGDPSIRRGGLSFRAGGDIIVDANQGWTKESCLKFTDKVYVQKLPITFIEQPLHRKDIEGLHFVKKRSHIPIAVDESLRTLQDAHRIVEEDAADIFNIKVAKIGLLEAIKIVQYLKKMKKRLMIGCMMESKVGLATSIHWACGSGDFHFMDLDSFLLIKNGHLRSGFTNRGPFLSIRSDLSGSGVPIAKLS